jgi:GNAT superfamily N-acetyltransferase
MQIRPATPVDLDRLADIDATIESSRYLHLERGGEGVAINWRLDERPLRSKLIDNNAPDDQRRFAMRQVVVGIEEGIALAAEHQGDLVALAIAQVDAAVGVLRLIDLRVDYDQRRQGIGSALLFQIITAARERGLRAVGARTLTNNLPASQFLSKAGLDLTGVDTHFSSNHDLVQEAVSLFWYAALD